MKYIGFLLGISFLLGVCFANYSLEDMGYSDISFEECTEIVFNNPSLSSGEYFVFVSNLEFFPLRDNKDVFFSSIDSCVLQTESFLSIDGYTGQTLTWISSDCLSSGINTLKLCLFNDELNKKTKLLSNSYFYQGKLPVIKRSDIDVYFDDYSKYRNAKVGDEIKIIVNVFNSGSSSANIKFNYVRTPLIEEFVENKEIFRFLSPPSFSSSLAAGESISFPIFIKLLKPETFSLPPVSIEYTDIFDRQVSSLFPLQVVATSSLDYLDCYFHPDTSKVVIFNNSQETVSFILNYDSTSSSVSVPSLSEKAIPVSNIAKDIYMQVEGDKKTCPAIFLEEDKSDNTFVFLLLGLGALLALGAYFYIMKS